MIATIMYCTGSALIGLLAGLVIGFFRGYDDGFRDGRRRGVENLEQMVLFTEALTQFSDEFAESIAQDNDIESEKSDRS